MPRFSVVVPVYNAEKYLDECINSVLSQSFADVELVLVDDGSPDSSGHICDRFAALDERVKVIHQQNQGHITARMNGANAASGEYILFLDSDDWLLSGSLEKIDDKIAQYSCDMLVFRLVKNEMPCADFFGEEKETVTKAEYLAVNVIKTALNSLVVRATKRCLFDGIDISSFAGFLNSEDLLLSLSLVRKAGKISYIPDVLYSYRANDSGITAGYNKNGMEEFVKSRAVLWAELEEYGIATEKNQLLLNTAFMRRAADTALQITATDMSYAEKKQEYRKISDMPFFKKAIKMYSVDEFGFAKQLRIKFLKHKLFLLLFLVDKFRLNFDRR